jgi:hypothetical protein
MKRLFIAVTATGLATVLVPVRVHANAPALDAAGTLFVGDGHYISKHAPDGKKSSFATGIDAVGMAVDYAAWKKQFGRISTRPTAPFLVTLKLDAQSDWKIVKTHQMSDKEVDKKDKEQ